MPASICLTEKSNFPSDRTTAASRRHLPRPVPLNAPSLGFTEGPESPTWTQGANFQPGPQPRGLTDTRRRPRGAGPGQNIRGERDKPGVCREGVGAGGQPRHAGLRRERFDPEAPGARRPGGKGRGRGPARPGGGGGEGPQGLHANAEPRPEGGGVAAAAEPGALRESQGRSARFGAEEDSAGREHREPGTRTGRGTHRAGGGGRAGRRGAGCILPPQAGFEALHGQVRAVPLPAGAARLPCARTLKSGLAARAEEQTAVPAVSAPPATWRPPATDGCQPR